MNISVYRLALVKETSLPYKTAPQMHSPADVADVVRTYLKGTDREHFVVLFLNTKSKLIGIHTVSIGDLSSAIVHPREVFKGAMLANADTIICAHNHPSNDAQPSDADLAITRKLVEAGRFLDIKVQDHVIVADDHFISLASRGVL